jgi:pyruvate dehydrogenase E1 component
MKKDVVLLPSADSRGPNESRIFSEDQKLLESIENRILWLATRMIDYANRERENLDGLKVGGHQASSASMVSLMTALYFSYLDSEDRISIKPHASPVFHAIEYLLGNLDQKYLTQLRSWRSSELSIAH